MSNADIRKRREALDRTMTPEEQEQQRAAKRAERVREKEERAALREAKRAERAARAAELGIDNRMSALREAKKNYTKSATGQLRTSDELAIVFDAVVTPRVINVAMQLLRLEVNPYLHLNPGQQSMNLRNKLRGSIRRGELELPDVVAALAAQP